MKYATAADLETWLGGAAPADADRLLTRASGLLDAQIISPYPHSDAGDPVVRTVVEPYATALKDAACAQVEWWIETGDETESMGAFRYLSSGNLSLASTGMRLAPRAKDALDGVGLKVAGAVGAF